jgi:hypothetical protein
MWKISRELLFVAFDTMLKFLKQRTTDINQVIIQILHFMITRKGFTYHEYKTHNRRNIGTIQWSFRLSVTDNFEPTRDAHHLLFSSKLLKNPQMYAVL